MRTITVLVASATFVCAGPVDAVVKELTNHGFTIRDIRKTWLGRVKIEATKNSTQREVVVNPYTGELLRDFVSYSEEESAGETGDNGSGGHGEPGNISEGDHGEGGDGEGEGGEGDGESGGGADGD
jgi:hypothetical protein